MQRWQLFNPTTIACQAHTSKKKKIPAIGFTYLPWNMRSSVNPAPPHVSA